MKDVQENKISFKGKAGATMPSFKSDFLDTYTNPTYNLIFRQGVDKINDVVPFNTAMSRFHKRMNEVNSMKDIFQQRDLSCGIRGYVDIFN